MYFLKKYKKGIFNKYSAKKTLFEVIIKDFTFLFYKIIFFFRNGFKNKNIFIFPHYPGRRTGIYQIINKLGYNLTNKKPKKFELAIYWEYSTIRTEFKELETISKHHKIINLYNRDISKINVDAIFTKIFGYSSFIDPLEHQGKCVKKGDVNGVHDGEIIECPIENREDGYVYQKFLETSTKEQDRKEIRLTILNYKMIFALEKYRTQYDLFGRDFFKSKIVKPKDVFSEIEIDKILAFCKEFNLEYGELDILRNNDDNKIYIIDVNNTPQQHLGKEKEKRKLFYKLLAKKFHEEFFKLNFIIP